MANDFQPRKAAEYETILSVIKQEALKANSGEFVEDLKKFLYHVRFISFHERPKRFHYMNVFSKQIVSTSVTQELFKNERVRIGHHNFYEWFIEPLLGEKLSLLDLYGKRLYVSPKTNSLPYVENELIMKSARPHDCFTVSKRQIALIAYLFVTSFTNGLLKSLFGIYPDSACYFFTIQSDTGLIAVKITCETLLGHQNPEKHFADFICEAEEIKDLDHFWIPSNCMPSYLLNK